MVRIRLNDMGSVNLETCRSLDEISERDPWHPTTEAFAGTNLEEAENFEEQLLAELQRAAALMDPKLMERCALKSPKQREELKLFQLRKVFDLLAPIFGENGDKPKQDSSLAKIMEFCWQPGEDGFAMANSETAFMRFGAASWCLHNDWFRATSQRLFGVSLKDDAELRCPNCVAGNKLIQQALPQFPELSEAAIFLRSLVRPTSFTHGEMKKQSINRHVIDFSDAFGVRTPQMRDAIARQKFKRLAAAKKPKPQSDFSI